MRPEFTPGKLTILKHYSEDHVDKLCEWYYDMDYRFFFRDFKDSYTMNDLKKLGEMMEMEGTSLVTILDKEANVPIGLMTYNLEKPSAKIYKFGILMDKNAQHKSYAIDAIIVMCDYVFNKLDGYKFVVEFCDEDKHIHRITKQGGFNHEATLTEELFVDNTRFDEARYSLFASQFNEMYGKYLADDSIAKPEVPNKN